MIEFQSKPERMMPLRMMVYKGLLYQHLIKTGAINASKKLPQILPVVIYNGKSRWRFSTSYHDIIENYADELSQLSAKESFLLIETNRIPLEKLDGEEMIRTRNFVSRIFKLEQAEKKDDIIDVMTGIYVWLQERGNDEFSDRLMRWFNRVLKAGNPKLETVDSKNFAEVKHMLAETMENWRNEARAEGRQEGLEKGREEGIEKGILKTAREFKQLGVDIQTIIKATGLSKEQINEL
jgi:predicted transposase/invertase (TIGR01784 family)